jgi:hypothetical protein
MKPEPHEKDKKEHGDEERDAQDEAVDREKLDPEFERIAKENLKRYRPAMKELAK